MILLLKSAATVWVVFGFILMLVELIFIKFYDVPEKPKELTIVMQKQRGTYGFWDYFLLFAVALFSWVLQVAIYVLLWPRSYRDFHKRIQESYEANKSTGGEIWDQLIH